MVAVVGGSLGARRLNDAALALGELWRDRADLVIHHVTGERDYEECRSRLAARHRPGDQLDYKLVRFEEHMDTVYTDATVMVSRAGGMTAELAAVGMPAVLVPLPGAPGDHQTRNAEAFALAGAAVVVRDDRLDGAVLSRELGALLDAPARLAAMSDAARAGPPGRHGAVCRSRRGGSSWPALSSTWRASTFRGREWCTSSRSAAGR